MKDLIGCKPGNEFLITAPHCIIVNGLYNLASQGLYTSARASQKYKDPGLRGCGL